MRAGAASSRGGRCCPVLSPSAPPPWRWPTGCSRTASWLTCPAGSCAPCTRPATPGALVLRGRAVPGHLCFVDERFRRLFSSDHVLPRITPNISGRRATPPDPLGDYLDPLARTRDLDVDEVLPAHEWRFLGPTPRPRTPPPPPPRGRCRPPPPA